MCAAYLPPRISEAGHAAYEQMLKEAVVNPDDVQASNRISLEDGSRGVPPGDYDS